MAFSARLTDDLIRIVAAGGGVRLDAGARMTDDLIRIAAAAKNGGARLYLVGMSARLTDDLVRISTAGKGSVVFED
jgi:DNA replication protein